MSTYCIADIHGCYDEFMELLQLISFNPDEDILYVLWDVIDRGDRPIDCLQYIMRTKNVHLLLGNHEHMMLDYFDCNNGSSWFKNKNGMTLLQYNLLSGVETEKIIKYLRNRPLYKTVNVNNRRFFLSHAGLNAAVPFKHQQKKHLIWGREDFYQYVALPNHICIFGHTPTSSLYKKDCSIWLDELHNDKINIDCGCVFGGALAALRLDDGAIFYVKSKSRINFESQLSAHRQSYDPDKGTLEPDSSFGPAFVPKSFLDADRKSRHMDHVLAEFGLDF